MAKHIPRDAKIVSLGEEIEETAAPVAVEEEDDPKFITVHLSRAIQTGKGETDVIKMRKPCGQDSVAVVDSPVNFDPISDPPKISHNMPAMVKMIARLSGLSTVSIGLMDTSDLMNIAWTLTPHFLPRPGVA
jgi:hypothetical protein